MNNAASTLIIFHANCSDGFTAAWAASLSLGRSSNVVYVPANYGDRPPAEIYGGSFARIFILDFSYNRATLERIAGECEELVVLDHHKSAAQELAGLPCARFDMDKSGAMLAWEYFHPGKPAPMLVRYVQDRDLWRWELPLSREFSAALAVEPRDFGIWSSYAEMMEKFENEHSLAREYFESRGSAILAAQKQHVGSLASQAGFREIGGHRVPVVNSPIFQSELGHKLCEKHPDAPFAAVYFVDEKTNEEQWSLRGRGDFDVSEVAKVHGGGGHYSAAGFRVGKGGWATQ